MDIYSIIAQLLVGWLIADFISGVLHWAEDRLLWATIPVIGPLIVVPNRAHHKDPYMPLAGNLFARNWTSWLTAVICAVIWFAIAGFSWVFLGAALGGAIVTEVHAIAHRNNATGILRVLQQSGIIQSPGQHLRHHRGEQNSHYCSLTDWLNPWLEWVRLWERLENGLTRIGLEPNRGTK